MFRRLVPIVFSLGLATSCRSNDTLSAARLPEGWRVVPPPDSGSERLWCANRAPDEWAVSLEGDGSALRVRAVSGEATPDSLAVDGGWLVGWDYGEFGGGIAFRSHSGRLDTLLTENLHALILTRRGVRALVGLAHLSMDEGAVFALTRDTSGDWRASKVADLEGAPRAHVLLDGDTLLVLTTRRWLQVLPSDHVTTLALSELWWPLYANSVARDRAGNVFIGMRAAIARLSPRRGVFVEEWLVEEPCVRGTEARASERGCVCFLDESRASLP